tara:strand:+ start:1060 stop:1767 length:708 start_codon:yes stop_codon:yes gene_type:complete
MKIVIITPLEAHHKYIISEISKKFKEIYIVNDTKKIKPRFNTNYKNLVLQKNYEKKLWTKKNNSLSKGLNKIKIHDVNLKKNIIKIQKLRPNLIITSGAIKLNKNFLKKFKDIKIINLHGGDPNYYRGLDSLMWAIYHNDFKKLKVSMHYVKEKLDCGDIIDIKKIKIHRNMKFYQLRAENVENTKKMLLTYLQKIFNNKKIKIRKNKLGKYYSFMPSILKDIVERKFNNYTKKL